MMNVSVNYYGTKFKRSGKVFQAKRAENAKMKGEKIQYSLKVELQGEGAGRQTTNNEKHPPYSVFCSSMAPTYLLIGNVPFISNALGRLCLMFPNHPNFLWEAHTHACTHMLLCHKTIN